MINLPCIAVSAFAVDSLPGPRLRSLVADVAFRGRTGLSDGRLQGRTPEERQGPAVAVRPVKHCTAGVEGGDVVEDDASSALPAGFVDWRIWRLPFDVTSAA